ncbi:hypothetical protein AA15237_2029 [Komagataeibacter xylinus NBRC 15237]|nr:hypothetical protein AA15237_2029 [Komagataeibacter xylinus NBRC 15237]
MLPLIPDANVKKCRIRIDNIKKIHEKEYDSKVNIVYENLTVELDVSVISENRDLVEKLVRQKLINLARSIQMTINPDTRSPS